MMRDKPKYAAALSYNPETDLAPRIVAKGRGEVAAKILAYAKENGVPIQEDRELVETLLMLDLGQEIPSELYRVVAEILSFVYRLEGKGR
jgi:flagellar biosynthesis protein